MGGILDVNARRLDGRVAREISADKPLIPGPSIFGVAGGVDPGKPATRADKALKGSLLIRVKDVSRRAEKDDNLVSGEFGRGEPAGILGSVDAKTMLGAKSFDRGDALGNRVVTKAG